MMQLDLPVAEVNALAQRARPAGLRLVRNPAPASPLPDTVPSGIDVLVVSEPEAAFHVEAWAGLARIPAALPGTWKERFGIATVLTLWVRGAFELVEGIPRGVAPADGRRRAPTGAGVALAGTLAAALDRGATLRAAVVLGVRAVAVDCTHVDAQRPA